MVTAKYMFIVLSADDDGEGGTFALYSLLARYVNITTHDPNIMRGVRMDRQFTGDLRPTARNLRSFIEGSRVFRAVLKVVGVLGVSMVMGGST
jgi:KUP system potassium uptake protein